MKAHFVKLILVMLISITVLFSYITYKHNEVRSKMDSFCSSIKLSDNIDSILEKAKRNNFSVIELNNLYVINYGVSPITRSCFIIVENGAIKEIKRDF